MALSHLTSEVILINKQFSLIIIQFSSLQLFASRQIKSNNNKDLKAKLKKFL